MEEIVMSEETKCLYCIEPKHVEIPKKPEPPPNILKYFVVASIAGVALLSTMCIVFAITSVVDDHGELVHLMKVVFGVIVASVAILMSFGIAIHYKLRSEHARMLEQHDDDMRTLTKDSDRYFFYDQEDRFHVERVYPKSSLLPNDRTASTLPKGAVLHLNALPPDVYDRELFWVAGAECWAARRPSAHHTVECRRRKDDLARCSCVLLEDEDGCEILFSDEKEALRFLNERMKYVTGIAGCMHAFHYMVGEQERSREDLAELEHARDRLAETLASTSTELASEKSRAIVLRDTLNAIGSAMTEIELKTQHAKFVPEWKPFDHAVRVGDAIGHVMSRYWDDGAREWYEQVRANFRVEIELAEENRKKGKTGKAAAAVATA